MRNVGRKPPVGSPRPISSRPAPRPAAPPATAIASDSPSTSASTRRSVKPSVFSTASSPVRSRIDWAIVLPVITRMVKKTAASTAVTRAPMSPIWSANPCRNACSVEVRVSAGELAKRESTAAATSVDRAGSSTRITNWPMKRWPCAFASIRYSWWK